MNLSKISYSFSQAKKNMIRNGLMTVASLFTISSCLIILGLFTVLTLNVNYISTQVKDQCEVQLYLLPGTTEERVISIKSEIEAVDNVKEAILFTKEDMLKLAKEDMFDGREEYLTGLEGEDNPFCDSYKITLTNIEATSDTVEKLESMADVEEVANEQDIVNIVVSISNVVQKLSLGVMILLFIIAIVIISNTVKLTVFNRRKEISIMKYIGATDRFIRVPFIMEGVLIGFLSAIVSFLLVSWGYITVVNLIHSYSFEMIKLIKYIDILPVILVLFIIVGCSIGMTGSLISMKKYLKA